MMPHRAVSVTGAARFVSSAPSAGVTITTPTPAPSPVIELTIPGSTTLGTGTNNGTLRAVLGELLTVTYVDPTDSLDTSNDTATIRVAGAEDTAVGEDGGKANGTPGDPDASGTLQVSDVALPEQPQPSSSSITTPVR